MMKSKIRGISLGLVKKVVSFNKAFIKNMIEKIPVMTTKNPGQYSKGYVFSPVIGKVRLYQDNNKIIQIKDLV